MTLIITHIDPHNNDTHHNDTPHKDTRHSNTQHESKIISAEGCNVTHNAECHYANTMGSLPSSQS